MLVATFLASVCLALAGLASSQANSKKIACYYSSWATYRNGLGRFTSLDIDTNLCNYYIYAFAGLSVDYNVLVMDSWLSLQDGGGKGDFALFTGLRQRNSNMKLLIGIGGWNEDSGRYSRMVSTPRNRQIFIDSALSFVARYGFDGINIDWQYPANRGGLPSDKQNFAILLKEINAAFQPKGYVLGISAAGNTDIINTGYDVPEVTKYVDFVSILSYDYHGGWESRTGMNAPLYPKASESSVDKNLNQDSAISLWIKKGADVSKLLLGIPTYGRSFVLQDPSRYGIGAPSTRPGNPGPFTQQDGYLGYLEIAQKFSQEPGWIVEWDDEQKVPYAHNGYQWIGYDNEDSVRIKAEYVMKKNLGGAMIWSLETDDFHGISGRVNPLLNSVRDTFGGVEISRTSQRTTTSWQTTTPKAGVLQCTQEGSFQHPDNCRNFYTCIRRADGFQIVINYCPTGLAFDKNTKACNWIDAVPECK